MKRYYVLVILLLAAHIGFCQTIGFSTLRQIFNYQKGDSFEYDYGTSWLYNFQNQFETANCGGKLLMVIDSVYSQSDTLVYKYTYAFQDTNAIGPCSSQFGYGWIGPPFTGPCYDQNYNPPGVFEVCNPDSFFPNMYSYYEGQCNTITSNVCFDTAFIDSNYHYRKQNRFSIVGFSSLDETCTDSLGLTNQNDFDEAGDNSQYLQLIWYHKAEGEIWGSYSQVIVADINGVDASASVNLFPNPSNGNLHLQLAGFSNDKNYFELFDLSGRKVYSQNVVIGQTDLVLPGFSAGLYFWQIKSGNSVVKNGKLVLQ